MDSEHRQSSWKIWLCLLCGLGIHTWLGREAIVRQSPTYDEPLYPTVGYTYWRTRDYRYGYRHPPLARLLIALPLLGSDLHLPIEHPRWPQAQWDKGIDQFVLADHFLYHNRVPADKIVCAGRWMIFAISCAFSLALFYAAYALYGPVAGWTAFVLAIFCPGLLAHGTLATSDFLFSAMYFLFFYCFGCWERVHSLRWAFLAGITLGLTLGSKFSAVAVGPVLLCWAFYRRWRFPFSRRDWFCFFAAALGVLLLIYQGVGLPLFGKGLMDTMGLIQQNYPTFLLGRHNGTGWWYYFPIVVLLKTPLPVLLGFGLTLYFLARREIRLPWFIVLPPLVYFLLACRSSLQVGLRHILPIYPFLYLMLGATVSLLWNQRLARILALLLGMWFILGTWQIRPFFLSYFNEFVGGPQNGHYFLTDSNLDWGQGLIELRNYMDRRGIKQIYLSYFGTARPDAYGITYISLFPIAQNQIGYWNVLPHEQEIDIRSEPRALLVISATDFQCTYFKYKGWFHWLRQRPPDALLAGSLLVFDITDDAQSHRELAVLFWRVGKRPLALREQVWAEELSKRK